MLKRWTILAIALLLHVSASAQTRKQADRDGGTAKPIAVAPAAPPYSAPRVDGSQHGPVPISVLSLPPKDRYDRLSFSSNVLLALVGIAGIVVAVCTLRFVRRQVYEMAYQRVVMRRSLTAMWRQTGILEASVAVAQKAADSANAQIAMVKSKERARVAAKVLRLDTLEFGDFNTIKITIENLGPTHAFNVTGHGYARPLIEGFESLDPEPDDLWFPNSGVIRAGSDPLDASLVFFFPEEWGGAENLVASKISIEVMGTIDYTDVFGDCHVTKFSYVMIIIRTSPIPGISGRKVHPFSNWRKTERPEDNHAT